MCVFCVTLTVGPEIGIVSGVFLSWLLTLARAYGQPVSISVLRVQQRMTSALSRAEAAAYDDYVVTDKLDGVAAPERTLPGTRTVVVLSPRFSIVFSNCEKLKVCVCVSCVSSS